MQCQYLFMRTYFSNAIMLINFLRIRSRLTSPDWQTVFIALLMAVFSGSNTHGVWAQTEDAASDPLTYVGLLKDKNITESSGLAASALVADAYWTMNDSGNDNTLFLFGPKGQTLARCEMKNAENRDWEAMASIILDNRVCLLVADTGDNLRRRATSRLYCDWEPKCKIQYGKICKKNLRPVKIEFDFDGGTVNCEAIGYDAQSNSVFLVEKQFAEVEKHGAPKIYQLKVPVEELQKALDKKLSGKEKKRARKLGDTLHAHVVAELPVHGVTGMSFSPDGNRAVIRTYLDFHLYEKSTAADKPWAEFFKSHKPIALPLPLQAQGEAICFSADSKSVVVTSEKAGQAIWKIDIDGLQKQVLQDSE